MTFGKKVIDFLTSLENYPNVPKGIEVLNPYVSKEVVSIITAFYNKYYSDNKPRKLLIGINPGRLGAGLTGIPFTDPQRLKSHCAIENSFDPKPELSSRFIYDVIDKMGGASSFYDQFYFSSTSPLGFVKDGKNLNYYDSKELQQDWQDFMVQNLKHQIAMGVSTDKAYVLGRGKNFKYLKQLNKQFKLFEELIELPHPRWVMQYRLKSLSQFLEEYETKLYQ